jgi:hypothetical protein
MPRLASVRPLLLMGLLALTGLLVPAAPARAEDEPPSDPARAVLDGLASKDAEARLEAAKAAANLQDERLLVPLLKAAKDEVEGVRQAAIEALRTRSTGKDRRRAAQGLAARLPLLEKEAVREEELLLVVHALHDLAEPISIPALIDIPRDSDREVVKARLLAVGNVPSAKAIEALLVYGSRGRRGNTQWGLTREALAYALGVKLTGDVDVWRIWWKDHARDFDFEAAATARAEARAKEEARRQHRQEKKHGKGKGDGEDGGDGK